MELKSEQRLFIRIMRLTLLQGIAIGMLGILTGLRVYNFLQPFFPPSFEGPLGPLYIMLCGAMIVLQGETVRLRSQFLALPQERNRGENLGNFSKHLLRLMGSFFMLVGFALLISKPLKFPDPTVSNAQSTSVALFIGLIFLAILLGIGGISWYLSLRDKHHAAQREQEGQRLGEDEMM